MGSGRKNGAGKSLDALVRAFRENPFAVFVLERSSVGVFERDKIQSAGIALLDLPRFPRAVQSFFAYANLQISPYEYRDSDGQSTPLSRVQFNMAFSVEVPSGGAEFKYRLERDREYLPFYTYGGMTARVIQMMPKMIKDFYEKVKHGDLPIKPTVPAMKVRQPRNSHYVTPTSSLVA